ncbi:MAG: ParB N-terminal domain-containing protein [Catenulispora sp.]|nr:ParB N-terminal domain-containing protein [Catenulispora sp.]NUT43935.1 ParB N-terminal domain-containing protein [Thermoactinospora sp.]
MAAKTLSALYDPKTSERPQPGQLVHARPEHLVIAENVRKTVILTADFRADVKAAGVETPISAWVAEDGHLHIVQGQRRTIAAQDGKIRSVPVLIVAEPETKQRITGQLRENQHRAAMVTADVAAAYQQLAMEGMTETQIARAVKQPKTDVRAALALMGSDNARTAVEKHHTLTLEQGAVLAEFDDDPAAVAELIQAAATGGFQHKAQTLRDQRERARILQELKDKLTANEIPITTPPQYEDRIKVRVEDLVTRDGKPVDVAEHAACPGHAAYIAQSGYGAPKDEPYKAVYVCTDIKANGHRRKKDKPRSADLPPAEREQQREERRDVLRSNRAWDSAEQVRRAWLTEFVARSKAPKGTTAYVAACLAAADHQIKTALDGGNAMAARLLGFTENTTYGTSRFTAHLAALLDTASESRAQVITLAVILGAYEAGTSRQSWRSVSPATARYLEFLAANGYELSDVEKRACGHTVAAPAAPDPADDEPGDDLGDEYDADADADTDQPDSAAADVETPEDPARDEPADTQAGETAPGDFTDPDGPDDGDDLEQRYAAELAA